MSAGRRPVQHGTSPPLFIALPYLPIAEDEGISRLIKQRHPRYSSVGPYTRLRRPSLHLCRRRTPHIGNVRRRNPSQAYADPRTPLTTHSPWDAQSPQCQSIHVELDGCCLWWRSGLPSFPIYSGCCTDSGLSGATSIVHSSTQQSGPCTELRCGRCARYLATSSGKACAAS